jgi:hypothetical protein
VTRLTLCGIGYCHGVGDQNEATGTRDFEYGLFVHPYLKSLAPVVSVI